MLIPGVVFSVFLFVFQTSISGESSWIRLYGGPGIDVCYSVCETPEGNFILAGLTTSFGTSQDIYVVKIDTYGDTVWTKTIGGTNTEAAHHVYMTEDQNYILVGYTESYGSGGKDIFIVKIDSSGNQIWSKHYGGQLEDCAYSAYYNQDGTSIIIGYKNGSSGWIKGDLWILKINSSGDTVWTKSIIMPGEESVYSIVNIEDTAYALIGSSTSYGGGKNLWFVIVDSSGDTLSTKNYGGTAEDIGSSLFRNDHGEYLMTGYRNGTGSWTPGDLWILKADVFGDTLWTKTYAAEGTETGYRIFELSDGSLITGGIRGCNSNDFWLIKTDSLGDSLWSQTYGGSGTDEIINMIITSEGNFLMCGYTNSYNAANIDFMVVKTETDTSSVSVEEPSFQRDYSIEILQRFTSHSHPSLVLTVSDPDFYSIALLDITGRFVVNPFTKKLSAGTNIIEFEGISPGVFIIYIEKSGLSKSRSVFFL